ncbi:hypothetical protein Tco_1456198 [Tanacetum coccineum]
MQQDLNEEVYKNRKKEVKEETEGETEEEEEDNPKHFDIFPTMKELSTWMAFGGNTRDLGSLARKRMRITELAQATKKGIKRRRRDLSGDGVWILATASQRSRLKVDLEPSTWRRTLIFVGDSSPFHSEALYITLKMDRRYKQSIQLWEHFSPPAFAELTFSQKA